MFSCTRSTESVIKIQIKRETISSKLRKFLKYWRCCLLAELIMLFTIISSIIFT